MQKVVSLSDVQQQQRHRDPSALMFILDLFLVLDVEMNG